MRKVAKIAIGLPRDVLEFIERERKARGQTRSEFLRRAIEDMAHQERERRAVEFYLQGYRHMPEMPEEVQASHRAAAAALAGEPWE